MNTDNIHPIFADIFNGIAGGYSKPQFEIQTRFYNDHWENVWTDDNHKLLKFDSYEGAAKYLREHHAECRLAIEDGDITEHNVDDYKIAIVGA